MGLQIFDCSQELYHNLAHQETLEEQELEDQLSKQLETEDEMMKSQLKFL